MALITVDIDQEVLAAARDALGTGSVEQTVDAALRQAVLRRPAEAGDAADLARWRDDGGRQPAVVRSS